MNNPRRIKDLNFKLGITPHLAAGARRRVVKEADTLESRAVTTGPGGIDGVRAGDLFTPQLPTDGVAFDLCRAIGG